ncbi:hypothetical protein ACPRNU_16755 [Chromobacterium vaccinii]|uniref:hypothetical protein n=1 Tax=Chromobacterium vaccinii TaxID=1108595 RepID=UPI003C784655
MPELIRIRFGGCLPVRPDFKNSRGSRLDKPVAPKNDECMKNTFFHHRHHHAQSKGAASARADRGKGDS